MAETFSGFEWNCVCGHKEYGEDAPEACPQCSAADSFEKTNRETKEKDLAEELE